MRSISWLRVLAPLALLVLVACSKGPADTAKAFAHSLARGEINEAKGYCTQQAAGMIDMWSAMGMIKLNPEATFSVVSENVTGDLAEIKVKEDKSSQLNTIKLTKVDGSWKVNVSK